MKKIMFFLISLFIFFNVLSVNASVYSNYDTTYTSNYNCNYYDDTKKNFFQNIINLQSNYYDLVIIDDFYNNGSSPRYRLLLIPNNNTKISLQIGYSQNVNISNFGGLFYYLINYSGVIYYLSYDYNTSNTTYTNFYNCYVNNQCSGYSSFNSSSSFTSNLQPYTVNNNDSYTFYDIPRNTNISGGVSSMLYYSSLPVEYTSGVTSSGNNTNVYNKNVIINNQEYSINDNIPTFYQNCLNIPSSVSTMQQDTQINTIYSKIPTTSVNNNRINFSFYSQDKDNETYIYNFKFRTPIVHGRVNHSDNYFTFEKLDCDFNDIDYSYDWHTLLYNIQFSGISCTNTNLSNYDYIYFTLVPDYSEWDDSYIKNIMGVSLSTNNGFVKYMDYQQPIFEYFPALPSGFKIFFSSLGDTSNYSSGYELDLYSSNGNTYYSAYLTDDFTVKNLDNGIIQRDYNTLNTFPSVTRLFLNNSKRLTQNYGYLIYNDLYTNITPTTELYTFFDNDIMYSYEYSYNQYYYYDITTDTIESTSILVDEDIYNKPGYNSQDIINSVNNISEYINSLSSEIADISNIVEDFYNSLPVVFQTFIFVMFNIVCLGVLYKMLEHANGKEE